MIRLLLVSVLMKAIYIAFESNFRIYDPLDWIAAICAHIPDEGQQMIRYYGYYSNVKRGKLKSKRKAVAEYLSIKEPLLSSKEYRKRWAELIKKVYEVDSLTCPKCSGKMGIVAFVKEQPVIDKILSRTGLLEAHSHSPEDSLGGVCPFTPTHFAKLQKSLFFPHIYILKY